MKQLPLSRTRFDARKFVATMAKNIDYQRDKGMVANRSLTRNVQAKADGTYLKLMSGEVNFLARGDL